MINLLSLIKDTSAFKTILGDKKNDRLSHAYLIVCADKTFLCDYIKIFAKIIMADNPFDGNSRDCRLIDGFIHPDVLIYPKKDNIVTEDINDLIEESFVKPVEKDKKLFVLLNAQNMNTATQNKLLKTLEEPPQNVHILLGATTEYPLLPTVKSRVKTLNIPSFSEKKVYEILKESFGDSEKLKSAVSCGDGTLGKAIELYQGDELSGIMNLVKDLIVNLQSSKNVLEYSVKITESKIDVDKLLSVLQLTYRDMLMHFIGCDALIFNKEFISKIADAKGYTKGALVYILDIINEAYQRKQFNNNGTMLLEWLLFSILEGKHKWLKL